MLQFKQLIVTICVIFSSYTVALVLLLYFTGGENTLYDLGAVFAAVTRGGFLPSSTFLMPENIPRFFILGAGMIISALPFAFHYSVFDKHMRIRRLGAEVLAYAVWIALAIPVFLFFSGFDMLASTFHVVSASTNTGFQYTDLQAVSLESKVVLMVAMMVGGTAFSAAGGIKVGRFMLVFQRLTKRDTTDTMASLSAHSEKAYKESLLVIALFVSVALASGMAVSMLGSKSFDDSLFESISSLTTTGLSTGIIEIQTDHVSKLILASEMIAGKFEIVAILYIFFDKLRR